MPREFCRFALPIPLSPKPTLAQMKREHTGFLLAFCVGRAAVASVAEWNVSFAPPYTTPKQRGDAGRPCRASRGNAAKERELAERAACPRGPTAPGCNLPAQDRHRDRLRAGGTGTDPHHQHRDNPAFCRARKAGGATVRTVRAHAEIQSGQRLRGSVRADGSPRCGR